MWMKRIARRVGTCKRYLWVVGEGRGIRHLDNHPSMAMFGNDQKEVGGSYFFPSLLLIFLIFLIFLSFFLCSALSHFQSIHVRFSRFPNKPSLFSVRERGMVAYEPLIRYAMQDNAQPLFRDQLEREQKEK